MPADTLSKHSVAQLLALHSQVLTELKSRGICRSANNPTGDYCEWLVAASLGLTLADNSSKGFDGVDADGVRYQIKGRRRAPGSRGTQLSAIRSMDVRSFDILVAVMFSADWSVQMAVKIPHDVVKGLATFKPHVNGHVLHLRPALKQQPGVEDITASLVVPAPITDPLAGRTADNC